MIEKMAQQKVSDLVDEIVALAREELGPEATVTREGDAVAIAGRRLALRRIADVRLRDLIATAAHLA